MPRYRVTVRYSFEKDIGVWARDESEAEEKACDIVGNWYDVVDAEATDCEEDDAA